MVPFPVLKCSPVGNVGWIAHVATTPPDTFWTMATITASLVSTCVWVEGVRTGAASLIVRDRVELESPPELLA